MKNQSFAQLISGRDNNLNLIRILAAAGVLISHAYALVYGPGQGSPLKETFGYSLGTLSVWVFFCISGLLVTRSFVKSTSIKHWLIARALRIYPALLVAIALTVFLFGPIMTTLPFVTYATDPATWTYLAGNGSLLAVQLPLPGVFETLPHANSINGSLWTLPFELMCYAAVLVVGVLGIFRKPVILAVLAAALAALYFWKGLPDLYHVIRFRELGSVFILGVAAYLLRHHLVVRLDIAAGLAGLAFITKGTPVYDEALKLALAYGTFWLAFVPGGVLQAYNRLGDYSYGLYIYAFPVQQTLVHAFPDQTAVFNAALSLPITLGFAMLSWKLIERPAIGLKGKAAAYWLTATGDDAASEASTASKTSPG